MIISRRQSACQFPADYDRWAELGNPEWSWRHCLPWFRTLEDDRYCTGEFHGAGGPIPVVRWSRAELSPLQEAFLQACLDAGYPLQSSVLPRSSRLATTTPGQAGTPPHYNDPEYDRLFEAVRDATSSRAPAPTSR